MEPFHTFGEVVRYIEENYSNPKAFNHLENGHWKHISSESFIFDVKRLTYGLISLGLRRGDKVAILGESSPYWHFADFAIIIAGGVTVPLFAKISSEHLIYEAAQANIRYIFVEGEEQWKLCEGHRSLFEKVIALDDPGDIADVIRYHDLLQMGEVLWEKKPKLWEELHHRLKPDDVATIIYTAGSTGMPKGVQLTHLNLCHLVSFKVFGWDSDTDKYLSVLPIAHVFARQINLIMIGWGVSMYFLKDLSRLASVSKELRPSLMIVVPRLLEKMYGAMESRVLGEKNWLKRTIGKWAFDLAKNPSQSLLKKCILRPIADFLVYSSIRKSLGDNWRVILCGGAALDINLNYFFLNIGFPIYEGWGLTEGSTSVVNQPGKVRPGTVGAPLPGVKLKLGENDEVLLGGPMVMKGYYRHPDATQAAIDEEGWLHTGDKGQIDKDGFLKLTGRVKEQFKLSTGEYIAPSRIEHLLCQHRLVDLAMIVGERRKYATCFLFPERSVLKRLKKEKKQESTPDEDFLESPFVQKEMETLLEHVNKKINSWEKLVKWKFILKTPTIEDGELTPTLKLKRGVILENNEELVEEMYGEVAK